MKGRICAVHLHKFCKGSARHHMTILFRRFRFNYRAITVTTATNCHSRNPLYKGEVAEWQLFQKKQFLLTRGQIHSEPVLLFFLLLLGVFVWFCSSIQKYNIFQFPPNLLNKNEHRVPFTRRSRGTTELPQENFLKLPSRLHFFVND